MSGAKARAQNRVVTHSCTRPSQPAAAGKIGAQIGFGPLKPCLDCGLVDLKNGADVIQGGKVGLDQLALDT